MTLALLEAATVAMTAEERDAAVVAHDAPPSVFSMACAARTPMPQTARLSGARDDLTLSWPASPTSARRRRSRSAPRGTGCASGSAKGHRSAPESEPQVGETSRVRVHKSRMGYGWDFCPRLVHQGIWRPVTLGPAARELSDA